MKKVLLLLSFVWAGSAVALAQIPNGSTAPNFTVTDIDGTPHTLYDLLDQGKTVYLDVFATWCVPCWNYHNTHALKDIWDQYGPPGTDEAFVISIEGDASTSVPCIWNDPGCVGGTTGDWTDGTPYPIADYSPIMGLYQVTYYPTIFMVCPADKKVYEAGQQGSSGLWSYRNSVCPPLEVATTTESVENTICYGSNTGSIDISVSGGTGPYNYSWSNGANTQDLNNIPAGTYACTVTNAQGWTGETGPITVEDPPSALQLSLVETTPVGCNGILGSITVDANGGWSNYSFNWSNGMNGSYIEGVNPGSYICTVTDDYGCTKTLTTVMAPPAYPVASIAPPPGDITCLTPTMQLTASATGGYSGIFEFEWFASNGGNFTGGQNTFQPTINAGGNYTVQVSDAVTTCAGFATVIVTEDINLPSADAGPSMALTCTTSTAELEGSGSTGSNIMIEWTGINGGNIVSGGDTYTPTVDAGGDYVLVVTDSDNGCTLSDTTSVDANSVPPSAEATGGTLNCVVVNLNLNATTNAGSPEYAWTGPNGFSSSNQNPEVNESGEYVLTVTDAATGCTNTALALVETDTEAPGAEADGGTLTCTTTSVEIAGTSPAQNATFEWSGPNGFSSNNQNPSVSETGDYNLVVTDPDNGCTSTAIATVVENTTVPISSATTPGNLNCNTSQLELDGSGSSQGPNMTYTWTTADGNIVEGANTIQPTVDAIGTYELLVTDTENGCTSTASTLVEESPAVTATINTSTNVSCPGGSDGTATVTPGGGNSTYAYTWSNGETTETVSGLAAGTYTVVVTDGENCSAEATIDIEQPVTLMPNASATAQTAAGVDDGTATANPTGGTSGYTYLWSNDETTQTITDLAPGNYTVTVTDANGCTAVQTTIVNAYNCAMTAGISGTNLTCFGANNGTAEVALTGANDPVTYAWSNGENTPNVSDLAAGTYTVEVIDDTNCSAVLEITITEPEVLNANATSTGETSAGANDGTATANPAGGTSGYTFTWSNNETTQSISDLAPGTYTVTVTDANGCTDVQSVNVSEFGCVVTAQSTVLDVSCPDGSDGSVSLNMTGGTDPYTFEWSNGETTATIENLAPGTYTATVTDANGCVLTDSYEVVVNDNEAPAIAAQNTTLELSASGSANATLQTLNASVTDNCEILETTISPSNFDCSDLGEHTVTITATDNSNNITTMDIVVTVVDNLAPVVTCPSSLEVCWYDNVVDYGAPVAMDNCLSLGGDFKLEEGLPTGSSFPVGVTTQKFTFTDTGGNVGSCTFTVTVTEPIEVSVTNVKHDVNGQGVGAIDISVAGAGPFDYTWTDENGTVIGTSEDLEGLMEGMYTVEIKDANGCVVIGETIIVSNTSGTAEPLWLNGLVMRPNPTTGITQIAFANLPDTELQVSVVDAIGRVIHNQFVNNQYSIRLDCTDFAQGIYMVRFSTGTEVGVRKLVVGR